MHESKFTTVADDRRAGSERPQMAGVVVREDDIETVKGIRAIALLFRGMAVLPSSRGFHLGELLLKQAEDFALAHNCKRLVLSTTPFLLRAIRLYERAGFKRTAEGPHDLFGTPLFTMVKDLPD